VHNSKRVCVIGSSGGSGATTVACNLAMELAHLSDRRTALVDMNLEFGDVACAFDCTPVYSVADVCHEGLQLDASMLAKAMHELPSNVSILARPERIEQVREITAEGVQAMFTVMSSLFPYVVVDLPRAADYLNASAVMDSDRILIVTQLTVPFLRNATRIHKCLLDMGADEGRIEIVLNRCKSVFERISPDDVESHFGRPLFAMIPNDYRRVQTALDFGHPIVADSPNTPARLAIQKMARLIAGEPETESAPSFFNRMLGRSGKEKLTPVAAAGATAGAERP
jgi:pilus assembly protein CpaE